MPEDNKIPERLEGSKDRINEKRKDRDMQHPFGDKHGHKNRRHKAHFI